MNSLIIAQVGNEPARFEVVRERDGERAPAIEVPSPYRFEVRNRPADHLMSCLRWYFEKFLEYPFPPRTEQAANIESALEAWGRQTFDALFASGQAHSWMLEASRSGVFRLQILSIDPATLSWPWEALCDPQMGELAQRAQVERCLDCPLPKPRPLSEELPKDRISILLVTARPYNVEAQFRSISSPLVELIESGRLPATVHLLRPPTLDNLREHLAAHPHTYHVLHFDGHGSYQEAAGLALDAEVSRRSGGELVFEDKYGNPAPVTGQDLGDLLRDHSLPVVVLNACQSAMIDENAPDPFAGVAGAILRSGVRSVVAMAYSLYVRAGQEFLPAFYEALFHAGSVSEATRKGRLAMSAHPQRSGIAPDVRLRDWLIPVVYQQEKLQLSFRPACQRLPSSTAEPRDFDLPQNAKLNTHYAFTGRDGALLELERAMRRKPAGILIHGLAGVGKTTLARAFVHWLSVTEGLGHGCFWFTLDDIRSADHVVNEMGRSIFGPEFGLEGRNAGPDKLVQALREKAFLIVWDNFESVRGIPEAGIWPTLSTADQDLLSELLSELRAAPTKVLITSRSQEDWLSPADCFRVQLRGLRREEVWDYAAQILDKAGVEISRHDPALAELLESLGGHPLAMQAILSQIATHNISEVRGLLEQNFAKLSNIADAVERRLYASLKLIQQSLPDELARLLIPLALHERFVDTVYLKAMAASADKSVSRKHIERFTATLIHAGLLIAVGVSIYEIHPLLPSFLRQQVLPKGANKDVEKWTHSYVEVMGSLADELGREELYDRRPRFTIHQANFASALVHAENLQLGEPFVQLCWSLAHYAFLIGDLGCCEQLYTRAANTSFLRHKEYLKAASYFWLCVVATNTRDFEKAEKSYLKLLEITNKLGEEQQALAYSSLGFLAWKNGLPGAAEWFFKALDLCKRSGNSKVESSVYRESAEMCYERRDFDSAKEWLLKHVELTERLGDERVKASIYECFGKIAKAQWEVDAAKKWYFKSLEIYERLGDEQGIASIYHTLGTMAEEQELAFAAAGTWFLKCLQIYERIGDEENLAGTQYRLGVIARRENNIDAAEKWLISALQSLESLGGDHQLAPIYHQLGVIAAQRGDFNVAEKWCLKALDIFKRFGNESESAAMYHSLGIFAFDQREYEAAEKWHLRALETNQKCGNEPRAGNSCYWLGLVAMHKSDGDEPEKWFLKSLDIFERVGDEHGAALAYKRLGPLVAVQGRWFEGGWLLAKAMAGFLKTKDTAEAQIVARNFLVVLRNMPAAMRGKLLAIWKKARLGQSAAER
jgi:tetratricopeptide (TPR) repeat protein